MVSVRKKTRDCKNTDIMLVTLYLYDEEIQGRAKTRAKKTRETNAAMKKLNTKNSYREFEGAVLNNFGNGDYIIDVTFPAEYTDEQRQKAFNNFLRRLRRKIKKIHKEFKYVYVKAIGDVNGNIHYHIIVQNAIFREEILNLAKDVNVHIDEIYGDERGLLSIIKYLEHQMMDEEGEHKWECSRGLERPKAEIDDEEVNLNEVNGLRTKDDIVIHNFVKRHFSGYELIDKYQAYEFNDNEITGGFTSSFYLRKKRKPKSVWYRYGEDKNGQLSLFEHSKKRQSSDEIFCNF